MSRQGGGVMESVRREAHNLRESGVAIEVFATEDSDSASDAAPWTPLALHIAPRTGPSRFSYAPRLCEALTNANLDVLSNHGLWRYTSVAASRWHAKTKRPYLVSPHGMLDPWALRNSRIRKQAAALFFEDRHLTQARCLRALCASEEKAIRNYGLKNPVAIIPNGVDLPDLSIASAPPWGGVEGFVGAKVVLSLGRLHPKKNLMALLRAWKQLKAQGDKRINEWRIVIAGWDEGGYAEELKECARSLDLSQSVWFPGPLFGSQKEAAYRSAAAFALPSLSEGLPMVALEAWSYGLPVLMTPECNLPEGFEAGAALAMGQSAETIAEALGQLLALSDSERVAMGQNGRELCAQRFNWSHIARQTKDLFHWMLGEKACPAFVSG